MEGELDQSVGLIFFPFVFSCSLHRRPLTSNIIIHDSGLK